MTNIRKCLENWLEERCTTHAKLNEYRTHLVKEAFESGYQAAHEAQQKRIDELTEKLAFQDRWLSNGVYFTTEEYVKEVDKITALEARCKELEDALAPLAEYKIEKGSPVTTCYFNEATLLKAKKALSTKSLTEKEVG